MVTDFGGFVRTMQITFVWPSNRARPFWHIDCDVVIELQDDQDKMVLTRSASILPALGRTDSTTTHPL